MNSDEMAKRHGAQWIRQRRGAVFLNEGIDPPNPLDLKLPRVSKFYPVGVCLLFSLIGGLNLMLWNITILPISVNILWGGDPHTPKSVHAKFIEYYFDN